MQFFISLFKLRLEYEDGLTYCTFAYVTLHNNRGIM